MRKLKNWVQVTLETISIICCVILMLNANNVGSLLNITSLVILGLNFFILFKYGKWED